MSSLGPSMYTTNCPSRGSSLSSKASGGVLKLIFRANGLRKRYSNVIASVFPSVSKNCRSMEAPSEVGGNSACVMTHCRLGVAFDEHGALHLLYFPAFRHTLLHSTQDMLSRRDRKKNAIPRHNSHPHPATRLAIGKQSLIRRRHRLRCHKPSRCHEAGHEHGA